MADYAWSRIRAGGEVDTVTDSIGRERKFVTKRNIIMPGEKVTAKDVGGKAALEQMIATGSVRPYPFPSELSHTSTESPVNFLRRRLREAAEVEVSEEEQLLMATGMGEEALVEAQPKEVNGSS